MLNGSESSIKEKNLEALRQQQSLAIYSNQTYVPKLNLFKPDYTFYMYGLAQNQKNYEKKNDEKIISNEHLSKIKAVVAEYNDPNSVKNRLNLINFTKLYHSELKVYPKSIPDGVYIVTKTTENTIEIKNGIAFDEKVEVGVLNNKIGYIKEINMFNGNAIISNSEDEMPNYKTTNDGHTFVIRSPSIEIKNGMCSINQAVFIHNSFEYFAPYASNIYFFDYILKYQEIQNKIKYVKKKYSALTSFKKFSNDLHIAYIHNNEDRFDQVNVLVENGKIIKYINSKGYERTVISGGEIIKNKSTISVTITYADGSHPKLFFFEVLLL